MATTPGQLPSPGWSSAWVVGPIAAVVGGSLVYVATALGIVRAPSAAWFASASDTQRREQEHDGQNLLNLLYHIAEDQARKEGFVHRGIGCNICGTRPIRGIRYKCANCIDYDVCEACEPQDRHNNTHVFLQIRIPIPPLANPRTALLSPFYPGIPNNTSTLSWSALQTLQKETHFDQVELEALYEQFKSLSTEEGGITMQTFNLCLGPLGLEQNVVTGRVFKFFDRDEDGIINFGDLVSGLSVLCKGTQEEKLLYAFKGYDLHESGYITREELRQMFKAYFLLSMELVREVVKALEEEMMANFNDDADKPVSSMFTAPIPASDQASRQGYRKGTSAPPFTLIPFASWRRCACHFRFTHNHAQVHSMTRFTGVYACRKCREHTVHTRREREREFVFIFFGAG
eukprot:m.133745 g.133745  ORF g.133745 m.133745 type:complete len:402 (-) comp16894_c0_seq5:76-1281(-)